MDRNMSRNPEITARYGDRDYWEKRYETEDHKEWLCDYASVRDHLRNAAKPDDKILVIGCGNSSFSIDLFNDGYEKVISVDYASSVIRNMREKHPNLTWLEMDMRRLEFDSKSFPVVIEKATLDALMDGDRDPWHPSEEKRKDLNAVLREINRVITDNGVFISVSFAQPHFRLPSYARREFRWSPRVHAIGTNFHHFVYVMKKGESDFSDVEKYSCPKNVEVPCLCKEEDNENFLYNISP